MNRATEQTLIHKAAAGDRIAAEALIKSHQGSLYAYMLRMSGRAELAEDVVQEAFIRVLTNLDRFDIRFRFSTWLFTIARRVYLNMCERKRPTLAGAEVLESVRRGGPDESLSDGDSRSRTRDTLQAALLQLSPDQREVIILFHQHDWPLWLIADQLEMPLGTVKSHLHRGRTRLRQIITAQLARRPSLEVEIPQAWLQEAHP